MMWLHNAITYRDPKGGTMEDQAQTHLMWQDYNRDGLENKNLVVWYTGTASISMCPWCNELLIRFNLHSEAETLHLTGDCWNDFLANVMPFAQAHIQAMLETMKPGLEGVKFCSDERPEVATPALQLAYDRVIEAARGLIERYPTKPKDGLPPA